MNARQFRAPGALLAAVLTVVTAIGAAHPALAQDATGQGPAPVAAPPALGPELGAATPMTDLLTRMDALETQVARLTAANEELANRQHQIETKLTPPVPAPTLAPIGDAPAAAVAPIVSKSANDTNLAAMTGGASGGGDHATGPEHASAQRIAAVKAVIKPQTGDAALDEYTYGFRLYTAQFYPEAAQQLKLYIEKHPRDAQISQARNLLGRAYLDDGKPREAAQWFLTNYKADPNGARAADSLLNLAGAMRQLHDDTKACVALKEFGSTYAAQAQGRLREDYARAQRGLICN